MGTLRRLLGLAHVPAWRLGLVVLLGALAVGFGVGLMTASGYLISRAAEHPPTSRQHMSGNRGVGSGFVNQFAHTGDLETLLPRRRHKPRPAADLLYEQALCRLRRAEIGRAHTEAVDPTMLA